MATNWITWITIVLENHPQMSHFAKVRPIQQLNYCPKSPFFVNKIGQYPCV